MAETAPQRRHDRREIFNGVRGLARGGLPWRLRPNDRPRWAAVSQQTRRWMAAGVFEAIVHDLRAVLRLAQG
jgi:transposase